MPQFESLSSSSSSLWPSLFAQFRSEPPCPGWPRSSASVGSCTWSHLLLVPVSSARQIRTNWLCVDLGGSLQSARGCLWAHQRALIVDGAASPVSPVCVFDLPCVAQPVVEEGCFRAVHIWREVLNVLACWMFLAMIRVFVQEICRNSSNCGSSPASVAQELGILREGLLPDKAIVDPSSRFVLDFNFGVFQVRGLLLFYYNSVRLTLVDRSSLIVRLLYGFRITQFLFWLSPLLCLH